MITLIFVRWRIRLVESLSFFCKCGSICINLITTYCLQSFWWIYPLFIRCVFIRRRIRFLSKFRLIKQFICWSMSVRMKEFTRINRDSFIPINSSIINGSRDPLFVFLDLLNEWLISCFVRYTQRDFFHQHFIRWSLICCKRERVWPRYTLYDIFDG